MICINEINDLKGKHVFVRVDMDVPMRGGVPTEFFRLEKVLPTLKYLLESQAIVTIGGHIGRPSASPEGLFDPSLSTGTLLNFFEENLGVGNFRLLENLRFDPREEVLDMEFSRELAEGQDLFVNESFATSHRDVSSITGIPKLIPGYAGIQLKKETEVLTSLIYSPSRPFISVVGGAKVETKKPALKKLLQICDLVLVGGKLGLDWDEDFDPKMVIPVDYARENRDIGESTIKLFSEHLANAATILWAGPLGAFEEDEFELGTREIMKAMRESGARVIAGGGDTVAAINKFGQVEDFSFVSTGGGAMLDFIINGTLPGIKALESNV